MTKPSLEKCQSGLFPPARLAPVNSESSAPIKSHFPWIMSVCPLQREICCKAGLRRGRAALHVALLEGLTLLWDLPGLFAPCVTLCSQSRSQTLRRRPQRSGGGSGSQAAAGHATSPARHRAFGVGGGSVDGEQTRACPGAGSQPEGWQSCCGPAATALLGHSKMPSPSLLFL